MKIVTLAVLVGFCVTLGGCYEGSRRGYGYNGYTSTKVSRRDREDGWVGPGRTDTRKLYDKLDAADKLGGPKAE